MIRLILGIPIAALVTLLLFMLMRFMITTDRSLIEETTEDLAINITRQIEEQDLNQGRDQQRPDQQTPPPPPPPAPPSQSNRPNIQGVPIGNLSGGFGGDFNFNFDAPTDREARPTVAVPPPYPTRAAERGQEGYVCMEFTVTPEGEAINARVFESEPQGVLDRAARRGITRWRFQPQIVNGEPVTAEGMQYCMDFVLEEGGRGGRIGRR